MRAAFIALALALPAPAALALGPVDVTRPGALDAIREADPERARRIDSILRAAERMPCTERRFERAMGVEHEAQAARCSVLLMTSHPARRRLTFTLGGTP